MKTALEGDNAEEIDAKANALSEAAMKLGEEIYKSQQAEAGEAAAAPGAEDAGEAGKADDDVVDVDFEEVDDTDKK